MFMLRDSKKKKKKDSVKILNHYAVCLKLVLYDKQLYFNKKKQKLTYLSEKKT